MMVLSALCLCAPDQQLEESKRLLDQKTIGCFGQQIVLIKGAVKVDNEGRVLASFDGLKTVAPTISIFTCYCSEISEAVRE